MIVRKLFLSGLLLIYFGTVQAQYPVHIDATNKKLVLETLFDGKVNDSNEVVWKPDFNERLHFHVSDDGMCYTKIDTVFYYQKPAGDKFIVYLFTTNSKRNGKYVHFHNGWLNVSAALFAMYKFEPCQLETFNKHLLDCGDYGFPAGRRLVKIADQRWGLMFSSCEMSNGIIYCWESLYRIKLRHFREVLHLTTGNSNSGQAVGKVKLHKYFSKTRFVPGKNDFDDIIVTSKGTWLNEDKKIVPVTPKRIFRYNTNTDSYMLVYP